MHSLYIMKKNIYIPFLFYRNSQENFSNIYKFTYIFPIITVEKKVIYIMIHTICIYIMYNFLYIYKNQENNK